MYYGYSFIIAEPIKRLYYALGTMPATEYWELMRKTAIANPTDVPNELYRLFVSDHPHDPRVVLSREYPMKSLEEAKSWVIKSVQAEINDTFAKVEQPLEWLRTHCINIDQLIRDIIRLRSALTVNSGLYYLHNETAVTDEKWDEMARQLVTLQATDPRLLDHIGFFDSYFKDFDGSTGYHLPYTQQPFADIVLRALDHFKHKTD